MLRMFSLFQNLSKNKCLVGKYKHLEMHVSKTTVYGFKESLSLWNSYFHQNRF